MAGGPLMMVVQELGQTLAQVLLVVPLPRQNRLLEKLLLNVLLMSSVVPFASSFCI